MKKAVIVGSGAGGATAARELQGKFAVTVLEAGKPFSPFSLNLSAFEKLKKTGLFFDERAIGLLFPAMRITKTAGKMVLINGMGWGGTTTISAGNALRADKGLQKLGIDLNPEFAELYREIPVGDGHRRNWRETTKQLFRICEEMGLHPQATPKMGNYERCANCGRCVLGCPAKVKWDSRRFLQSALDNGASLISGCRAEKVVVEKGKARGVLAKKGRRTVFYPADLVILAAGGLGTPVILQNSGIACEDDLFVDPVLCVAAPWPDCLQNKEVSMPFIVQAEHFILSPYFDYLSFFFNKKWKHPAAHTVTLMIKLADSNSGSVTGRHKVNKALTAVDETRLREGVEMCMEILARLGVKRNSVFLGTVNAGHPGGMLPLDEEQAGSFHHPRLPENLYIADATLLPESLGNPLIFTIMALAKRVSRLCAQNLVNVYLHLFLASLLRGKEIMLPAGLERPPTGVIMYFKRTPPEIRLRPAGGFSPGILIDAGRYKAGNFCFYPQFFQKLAPQALLRCFRGFDFAAGKFPSARVFLTQGPPGDKYLAVIDNNSRGDIYH